MLCCSVKRYVIIIFQIVSFIHIKYSLAFGLEFHFCPFLLTLIMFISNHFILCHFKSFCKYMAQFYVFPI